MKKEFVKLAGILCLITLVAALLLAWVNKITAPKIAQAEQEASREAMKMVLPDADEFKQLTDSVTAGLKGKEEVGYCVNVKVNGYGGEIAIMVGIGADDQVKGIEILSHSETAGLGAKVTDDKFKSQFRNKSLPIEVVKNSSGKENEIEAMTGATVTSRAAAGAVQKAHDMVLEAKEGAK